MLPRVTVSSYLVWELTLCCWWLDWRSSRSRWDSTRKAMKLARPDSLSCLRSRELILRSLIVRPSFENLLWMPTLFLKFSYGVILAPLLV